MVSRRLRGAVVAAVCAVALAGCGSVYPGAAARVGEESISDEALERGTTGFCHLIDVINQAQQGTNPPVPLRTALLSALNTLVTGEAIDQLARRHGVGVSAAEVRRWIGGLPLRFDQVPAEDRAELEAVTERVARNTLLVEKLGQVAYRRQNPGGGQAPPDQVQQLGQQMVNRYLRAVGVETDPRYGQVLDTRRLPGTGSLSVPVSQEGVASQTVPDASSSLEQNQECA